MLAKTPPMGWNSWNTFGKNISEALIRETADAMVSTGLRDAGYEYLVIDDCWSLRERDENGSLVADPQKFPNGMKAVADYVRSKGVTWMKKSFIDHISIPYDLDIAVTATFCEASPAETS